MSVEFSEQHGGRSGSQDRTWFRRYVRSWLAVTDNASIGPVQIRQAFPVNIGNNYNAGGAEVDTGAFAESIRVEDAGADDGKQWVVTVEYGPYDANTFPANKLEWPIQVSWGSAKYERVVERDVSGNPVLNSAGDPFDPPATIDDTRPVLRVVRNEATFDPLLASRYKDHINSDPFLGLPAKVWKCADITGQLKIDNDLGFYYEVAYEFELRVDPQSPNGWTLALLDQGLRKRSLIAIDGDPPLKDITIDGSKITAPVLLDGSGGVLASGGTPVFREFDAYPSVAFSGLELSFAGAPGQSWEG